ncbi:hypothetical protein KEF85_09140 [Methylomonas paludis]|uniref:Uncharacterized protein n=1 Tax=Methylomonas paludis TaxID=1173101 RepID=A0A975R7R9_9GAMM|nr:VPLPA-CTERM sorting domain-containing protein [Methylomonas paludis]QWF69545.1 hypothetical protein KEF85_09140 [Methylomonas paludis]
MQHTMINQRPTVLAAAILSTWFSIVPTALANTTYTYSIATTPGGSNYNDQYNNGTYSPTALINDAGTVAGSWNAANNNPLSSTNVYVGATGLSYKGFMSNEQVNALVSGFNNNGYVVGNETGLTEYNYGSSEGSTAFYTTPADYGKTAPTKLLPADPNNLPTGDHVAGEFATGITDSNIIYGYTTHLVGANEHSFTYNIATSTYTDLSLTVNGVTESAGLQVGNVSNDGNYLLASYNGTTFVYDNATQVGTTITDPNFSTVVPTDVNNNGLVVGYEKNNSGTNLFYGFEYDLNTHTFLSSGVQDPYQTGYSGTQFTGINNNGVISGTPDVGWAVFTSTTDLIPAPLPGAFWLMSAALGGLGCLSRRKSP